MPIEVYGRDCKKAATFIGRSGVLGNPYTTDRSKKPPDNKYLVGSLEESRALYKLHLGELWETDEYFRLVLLSLVRAHLHGDTVVFACVDTGAGDILKTTIEEMAALGAVPMEEEPVFEEQPVKRELDQGWKWDAGEEDPF